MSVFQVAQCHGLSLCRIVVALFDPLYLGTRIYLADLSYASGLDLLYFDLSGALRTFLDPYHSMRCGLPRWVHLLLAVKEGLDNLAHELEVRAFVDDQHTALVKVLRVAKELEHYSYALFGVRRH